MPASTTAQKSARAARRSGGTTTTAAAKPKPRAKTTTDTKPTTKPAARRTRSTSANKGEVTVTFKREREPQGKGGVRFAEVSTTPVMRTIYVDQKTDKAMGNPAEIEVTIKAKS